MRKLFGLIIVLAVCGFYANAQNPFLPLWEHIPDGEPYVFEDPDKPGSFRVYIYGSHDNLRTHYCGRDQVVWSASVDNLREWRYDGVIFKSEFTRDGKPFTPDTLADVLYAPDVMECIENGRKVYYLCPNNQVGGRQNMIAKSYRPDGPFEVCNWNDDGRTTYGIFGFDPAIFCDDDGRIYGYWGFNRSFGAELDPTTMCTVKPGTDIVEDMISGCKQEGEFRFFEASSMRKINGKYVFIYSRVTQEGEFSLPSTNYTLAYAYSDSPLGPFTYGGTLIDGRARGYDEEGKVIPTANPGGNTHGSLAEINGQWYVFYHRQIGTNEFSRQAMVAPVTVSVKKDKVEISEAEYTSEGFCSEGLNPFERQPAGIACYYTGPTPIIKKYPNYIHSGSYVKATYAGDDGLDASYSLNTFHAPVVNNTNGSIIGYKYFNFDLLGRRKKAELCLRLKSTGIDGEIIFMIDSPWKSRGGKEIGRLKLDSTSDGTVSERTATLSGVKGLNGKHALYILFTSDVEGQSLCELYDFIFQ